jgi:hypothetical protein
MPSPALTAREVREHEARIDSTLRVVFRREGFEVTDSRTPLSELYEREVAAMNEREEDLEEVRIQARNEAYGKIIQYIFCEGPHPGVVLRRLYAITQALKPGLIAHMTQTDLAKMFAETKAAQSWRMGQIFSGYLKASGQKGYRAPGQRGETARANCAEAQRGNTNRRKKPPAAKQQRNTCTESTSNSGG